MGGLNNPNGITARQLREWLMTIKDDAYLVINGTVPTGLKVLNGKMVNGYFGPGFKQNPKGDPNVRYQGFTFTHSIELSNNEIVETDVF